MNARVSAIRRCLEQALAPTALEIIDQSEQHAGHAGAASGKGHFAVRIISEKFTDVPALKRHRMVYEAVGELMQTDIHALSIKALAPDEAA